MAPQGQWHPRGPGPQMSVVGAAAPLLTPDIRNKSPKQLPGCTPPWCLWLSSFHFQEPREGLLRGVEKPGEAEETRGLFKSSFATTFENLTLSELLASFETLKISSHPLLSK